MKSGVFCSKITKHSKQRKYNEYSLTSNTDSDDNVNHQELGSAIEHINSYGVHDQNPELQDMDFTCGVG